MLEPIKLPTKNISIIEDYLAGEPLNNIAKKHNLTPQEVSDIINSKPVTNFISAYLKNYSYLNPLKRIHIIEQLINNKLEEGFNTKKDIVDLLKLLQDEYKLLDKKQEENTTNNYVNIIKEIIYNQH